MAFTSLEHYYEFLEQHVSYLMDYNVLGDLASLEKNTVDEESKIACSAEWMIYHLPVYNEAAENTDPQTVFPLPDLSLVGKHADYFKRRAQTSMNPRFKGKYHHVLWLATKDNRHGHAAIDAYITALQQGLKKSQEPYFSDFFIAHFCALITLAEEAGASREPIVNCFLDHIDGTVLVSYAKVRIMDFLLRSTRKKGLGVWAALERYCIEVISKDIYPDLTDRFLHILVSLCAKLQRSPKVYHEQLGDLYFRQAKPHEGGFILDHFYRKAILHYKRAGNVKAVEDVSVLLEEAKHTFKFQKFTFSATSPDVDDFVNGYHKMIRDIVHTLDADDIYQFLISAPALIRDEWNLLGKNSPGSIADFCSVINFDINLNAKSSDDTQTDNAEAYTLYIKNFTCEFLRFTFVEGIASGKMSAQSLISYLRRHTWYGMRFTYDDIHGDARGIDWIELLTPALQNFFAQAEFDCKAQNTENINYVLCVDSLAIKFEGLLRECSRLLGAQTIDVTQDGSGERISFDNLLDNEKVKGVLPAEDHEFFKFLFTGSGVNLRNNIAHAFYPVRRYYPSLMWLLITAILRLGNIELTPRESATQRA